MLVGAGRVVTGIISALRRRACAKFAIKDCLDAMFIVGVRVPIDSLGWGGGRWYRGLNKLLRHL